jgi:hypothetical protein
VLPARLVMIVVRAKRLASIILLIHDGVFMGGLLLVVCCTVMT